MWYHPAQQFMQERRIDGWLVHDFRSSNPVLAQLLPGDRHLTRRVCLFVPARGEPRLLAHHIDASQFSRDPVRVEKYLTWQEYRAWLADLGANAGRVAMEYAPGAALPVVSVVDAGTIELVRSSGMEVVSSADLIQVCVAIWSAEALANHHKAAALVDEVKNDAFAFIRAEHAAGRDTDELIVQQRMHAGFKAVGLEWPDGPIVSANAHAGDPHYAPSEQEHAPIRRGDWVLIDLWARLPGDQNIFSDVTWVGFCGKELSARHRTVWEAVKGARDAALRRVQAAWAAKEAVQGWQVDDAARGVLLASPFKEFIRHRTGHSLSAGPKVHGVGVNIDNTETHDTRGLIPGIGFTIEPGLYLPDFGIRSEINVYMDPQRGPVVTSQIQDQPYLLG